MLDQIYTVDPDSSIFGVSAELLQVFQDLHPVYPLTLNIGSSIYLTEFDEALTYVNLPFLEVDRGSINGRAHEVTGVTVVVENVAESTKILGFLTFVDDLQKRISKTENERLARMSPGKNFYGKCGSGRLYGNVLHGMFETKLASR